jgi:hypothetical protein
MKGRIFMVHFRDQGETSGGLAYSVGYIKALFAALATLPYPIS